MFSIFSKVCNFKIFLVVLWLFYNIRVFAEMSVVGDLPFKIQIEVAKPIEVYMNDGRVAQLQIQKFPEMQISIPLKITETTCSDRPNFSDCKIQFGFSKTKLDLKWINNNIDPDRLGKRLVYSSSPTDPNYRSGQNLVESISYIAAGSLKLFPNERESLSPFEISCPDYRWLGQNSKSPPNDLNVVDWSLEFMLQNPETQQNENRGLGGAMGVALKKLNQQTLRIESIDYIVSPFNYSENFLLFGDKIGWVIKKKDSEELCQISMSVDTGLLTRSLFSEPIEKPKFEPYLYDPNGLVWHSLLSDSSSASYSQNLNVSYKTMFLMGLIDVEGPIYNDLTQFMKIYPRGFQ